MYLYDIFYQVENLDLESKKSILYEAYNKATSYHVDYLDCDKSIARQRTDLDFNEVIEKFDESCHFVVIYRRGEDEYKETGHSIFKWWCGEVGFTTMKLGVNYFLFIYLTKEDLFKIVDKFALAEVSFYKF